MTSTDADTLGSETAPRGPRTLRTLEKGLQLLGLFDFEHQHWTLRELREATGESKTNVLRITKTLEGLGYLVRDPGSRTLRLGPSIVRLSYVTLSHSELVRTAVQPMRSLSEKVRETADLMVEIELGSLMSLHDVTPRFLSTRPSTGRITQPGVSTAASKIFLAFRPEDTWREAFRQFVHPLTDRTILDPEQLHQELATVRRDGVAFDRGEWSVELCGVAAPIFGSDGGVRASLSVVSPVEQTSPEKMAEHADAVRATAAEISQELGAPLELVAFLRNRR